MLYVIPIEPLEERYSKQWLFWTRRFLYEQGLSGQYETICPNIVDYTYPNIVDYTYIEKGSFLDVVKTNLYKNSQMNVILNKFNNNQIKDGDIFWFHDMWFPGLEKLAYIRDALGIRFKIYGCLHAGTYDPHDFLSQKGMGSWGEHLEQAWFDIVDGIFVATHYHRRLISENRLVNVHKIHITGFPIYPDFVPEQIPKKENIVVFPHRLDKEKNPQFFDKIEVELDTLYASHHLEYAPKFQFIKTKEACSSKKEYYDLLLKAKYAVSFAEQETWGIAMQEAVLCGCIPVVPYRLSYAEMYPFQFLMTDILEFENISEYTRAAIALHQIDCNYNRYKALAENLKKTFISEGAKALPNMLNIMGSKI